VGASGVDESRRRFLKAVGGLGALFTLASFVHLGSFFVPTSVSIRRQQILDAKTGLPVRPELLQENQAVTFVYPRTGNPTLDSDPFRLCQLIKLPARLQRPPQIEASFLGKDLLVDEVPQDRRLVAYSIVCVHLMCLVNYTPSLAIIACPCHGSMYEPVYGRAIDGPAYLQPPPNNALPEVEIEVGEDGTLYAKDIIGTVGTGRYVTKVSAMTGRRLS
jgi:rieske iron-sulfur protein